ncbi:hypothetical protein KAMIYU_39 [Mycobacterium phage Kamiyu]|uniref:Tail assembly chaperone n=1 Tax=Mycobacterium phage Tydolla TaxID=2283262 RepID=A0A345MCM8_9CAUD|nr:hypothetical protein PHAEDRUS_37 [Mycobacterium phage Phaedrus]YP_002564137.1 gp39 [Mycobacterium phage Phlyer]AER50170.1 hypothetical protein KAMIYU_39 [Mycobacterium phage Kamiyu]AVJ50575.1 hypothetical protein PBI_NOZO_39 [Mycobacterium phage Nozo]AXH68249.1 hypothetical protein SEA_TYDOLLA_39 [Mycobacterium phage Tydolla]QOI67340.1 hypothetical protein SEA_GERVAS_39 [Mycobacterium phage Gervas]QYW01147.1 hypothetical protein SEA_YINZ_39 [Mycobacterium phage Yinz]WGH22139.1 hypothetica
MYEPPPGYDDLVADADDDTAEVPNARWTTVVLEGIGAVEIRRPLPKAAAALAMAANARISPVTQQHYLTLFVQNHVRPGTVERLFAQMMEGEAPTDTFQRVARAIATEGTARPTRRSLRSAS